MFAQPVFDVEMFVSCIIADNKVHIQRFIGSLVESFQKLEKFIEEVFGQTFPDHRHLVNMECGK